jgi:hypothetical protein
MFAFARVTGSACAWRIRSDMFARLFMCAANFPNPEELAYARSGRPALPLYRVRFLQRELWPDYAGHPADVLVAEIYQHWLEAGDDLQ